MYGSHTGRKRKVVCAVSAVAALLALSGCFASSDDDPDAKAPAQQPKSKAPYWVNPDGNAAKQAAEYRKDKKPDEAELIDRIAAQPVAEWIGVEDPQKQARGFTEAAEKADRDALLVLYNIPHRDCGQYSGGGAADGDAYRGWLAETVNGIGDRKATVILEPDALTHIVDECTPEEFHEERYALLKEGVDKLKALPNTTVYLDAGNPSWVTDPGRMAEPLKRAGIEAADGFVLNTSNYQTTASNTAYGKRLSKMVGGKHFVIDTSRNGKGPLAGANHEKTWCNPPGRGLGEPPTTKTADPLVDAYLWIKRPGESDGTCKGGPDAGKWWPKYALELARNSK
ncbi:glycoside hydrolase family 6 protein [Streptomyces sp. H27-D2]|uniref:glycoside hydrolase family 6 protein n=1 Tax=Streptomyces sp. H27-D2 TaxID=3046304 RepID=UPI002DBB8CC0|nr:glycoside hydrolase family 6 protein [Streptomyces sp. H27-D2]MEC4015181.1 glycoside hydrolase family 6 protein [Streptomyces sp. H27-D2]